MKLVIKNIYSHIIFIFALCMTFLMSCQDDISYRELNYVPEGIPSSVSLTITVPDMELKTRDVANAGMDPEGSQARVVNDLWVGIYNKNTGERKGTFKVSTTILNTLHNNYGTITIRDIPTYSGECYIVAVANYQSRNGANLIGSKNELPLSDLLNDADTWEKYISIIRIIDDPTIQRGGNNLIMSGVYQPDDNDESVISELEKSGNPPVVGIYPGTNSLPGRIHLRRLASYFRVNLVPNPYIKFTPTSWQIMNVPAVSYLHEQNGNAADLSTSKDRIPQNYETTYFNSDKYYEGTFRTVFGSDGISKTGYWFDFYQMENKHKGLENVKKYDDRELEYKNNELNTGWYRSLVSNPDLTKEPTIIYKDQNNDLFNNNASYMVITGDLDYYVNSDNKPVAENTPGAIHRIAQAKWTIHMGYCDGSDEEEKSKDFNCKRNSKYEYTIRINGVDNIRVEAKKEGEKQPGAEGIVNDIVAQVFSLDAHYGVFNIALSDNERENFTWRIQAFFGGTKIDMISSPTTPDIATDEMISIDKRDDVKTSLPDNQFYNWIQIRPTSGEGVIAHYPGDIRLIGREIPYVDLNENNGYYPTDNIKTGKNGVWYLEDLRDLEGHPHPYDNDDNRNKKKWYTIFIDEYVWEYPLNSDLPSLTGIEDTWGYYDKEFNVWVRKEHGIMTPTENWGTYVGEEDRKLWITSNIMYISPDQESMYSDAIYYITQESIQTYYSEAASYGIGIEITNESYKETPSSSTGNNYPWKFTEYNNGEYDPIDGYLNQYRFAQTYKHPDISTRLKWDEIYKTFDTGDVNGLTYILRSGSSHDGDTHYPTTYFIREHQDDDEKDEYMVACLSRNRDLNNDGEIGSNEIRWYLPTDQTYTRIILGAPSLRKPLFELNSYSPWSIVGGTGKTYSHYASSNGRKTWAEELAATGDLFESGYNAATLRCVRNIGQPTNWTPGNSQSAYRAVTLAYDHDKNNHIIEMKYYDNSALRNSFYGPGDYIRPHHIDEVDSYAFRKFKYAQYDWGKSHRDEESIYTSSNFYLDLNYDDLRYYDTATGTRQAGQYNNYTLDYWIEILENNGLCRSYYENNDKSDLGTWRTPNITELGIMRLFDDPDDHSNDILNDISYISCSREYFYHHNQPRENYQGEEGWFRRFMVTRKQGEHLHDIGARYPAHENFSVRCVKDVR